MKKAFLKISLFLLTAVVTLGSCSKKAKEETKEATEAIKDDVKEAAKDTKEAAHDVASDVKKGAQDVASDVKKAAKQTASTVKKVSDNAVAVLDAKLSKMSKSARVEYDALEKEIERVDKEFKSASASEKVKLEKTRARLIKRRDALLAE